MEVRPAALGDTPMLVVTGAVDRDTGGPLWEALDRTIASGHYVIFLDLSAVSSMDDHGLSMLLSTVQNLKRGWLGVIGANDDVRGKLDAGGFLREANVRAFATRQAALAVTGERAST